eukprot:192919-Lingulodinium_polyedra.AAC.1
MLATIEQPPSSRPTAIGQLPNSHQTAFNISPVAFPHHATATKQPPRSHSTATQQEPNDIQATFDHAMPRTGVPKQHPSRSHAAPNQAPRSTPDAPRRGAR